MKTDLDILTKRGISFEEVEKCIQFFAEDRCEGINLSANSPLFFIKDLLIVMSKLMNNAYNSCIDNLSLETATGLWLANAGFISTGLLPYSASKTTLSALLVGKNGTLLKQGFTIKSPEKADFFLMKDTIISNNDVYEVTLQQTKESFEFLLYFESFEEVIKGNSFEEILPKINYNPKINSFCACTITEGNLVIVAISGSFQIYVISGINILLIKTPAVFEAGQYGEIPFVSSKGIFESKEGLEDVLIKTVQVGREAEEEELYKQRVFKERENLGVGNSRFIESFKKANPNITYFAVFQNDEDETNHNIAYSIKNGDKETLIKMPRRSIECIVEGGDAYSIAKAIWDFKGQGVATFGNVSVNVKDEFGKVHKVSYSRPEEVVCSLKITLQPQRPIDLETAKLKVIQTVMNFVNKYNKIGTDFSLGRLAAFITENIRELENTLISAETRKGTQNPIKIKQNSAIKPAYNEILIFSENKIEVEIVNTKMRKNDTL